MIKVMSENVYKPWKKIKANYTPMEENDYLHLETEYQACDLKQDDETLCLLICHVNKLNQEME